MKNNPQQYTVKKIRVHTPDISTLFLTESDGTIPAYVPGQFINVYFPETNTPEGKAYSISSAPSENVFTITVRAIGEFSNRLCALKPGDTVHASLPYGFFYPEREDSDLIMLASGIGITPFRSMIYAVAANHTKRKISLFHSVRTTADALFKDEYEVLRKNLPGLSVKYFITRDAKAPTYALQRRMNADDIVPRIINDANTELLLCGSISFTRDLWRELRHKGVRQDAMYTEAFFSN